MRIGLEVTAAVRQSGGIGRYVREMVHALADVDQINQYSLFYASKYKAARGILDLPDISKPKATSNEWVEAFASLLFNTSARVTNFLCLLGISIPIALLPGIGARSLTSGVARA